MYDVDAIVVGAGAVGLACAYALSRRGNSVIVLEKERLIGSGVSSRNSEVIHAGLYYPTGSLKARLCVEGRRALYGFLEQHGVPYERCGKLVVATDAAEVARLDAIEAQAGLNGVEGIRRLTGEQARALEPQVNAVAALLSEETGIFDSHGYMLALQGEIEAAGGAVAFAAPFEHAAPLPDGGFRVRAGGAEPAELSCRWLVLAPGLDAQGCAAHVEGFPASRIPPAHYGKGTYFALSGPAPFQRLVYPPPIPGALGVHYKRDLGGRAHFGPDLEYVDHPDYDVDPARAEGFYAYVRRFWPALPDGALTPDYAGVRPKIHGPGEPQPDFDLDTSMPGLVALFGIESPGLTASLAIGEEVAGRLGL
ncbi:NAD(P)/FAD-dependent oxidoreductase [Caulobacter sp. 17J65-9]|uniref:NAD(P)/FAD-dependent oxidoreductase n=1 Tax=Caulobacter sp. 17J65-9 TaxID=2709382 RepID=UPI0013C6B71E|nr:NAD(P)/FAD-dependent oxidoreductase [Caulobacter sp. 17J65-9]NEX95199.1 NAD(P)/FAD-dependent oxidoreductase [Caulobacter sp. 17J65-9]